ncbi:nitroreductase family protein [Planctomyces sp. SH-PL62]|uniref:nitroreductase family protein n=1 Tax=Planctomyces sp. SH-PL62 TaxID=1636152 RepID=UPI00078D0275|nr:nitroreductase family protein [Planctomyces sp. SH-PL62]AMV38676.1 NADH dehydrogenase [Planctomyces sp. SH-PL62]
MPDRTDPRETEPRPLTVEESSLRRRPTPRFDPARGLAPELLERLLRSATLAPSPYELQPWRFLVVREPAGRRRLQACAGNQPEVGRAPVVVVVLGFHHPERSHLEALLTMRIESGECSPERAAAIRGRARSGLRDLFDRELWATRPAMLAAATLMLAAESLGVASALIEGFDAEAVRREFGVPDDHAVCGLVALGFADVEGPPPPRFGLDEVAFAEHFGRPWAP